MANSSNGRLWFTAGIDRSELSKGVTAINKDFAGLQTNAGRTGSAFSDMWKTAAAGVGAYLSATAALDMSQQIINLTRQRELMGKSFEVLFGGADAARQKIDELRDYAIITPYTFENLTKGAQTLSAFGFTADEIMPNLKLLADVAAGNNERFERLSLVFAQTRSAGKLMGQDLLQYVNAGFNPLQVISEKTGKSVSDLRKEMENGAISAEMVVDAFKAATSEGGKFYGMTEKMADSIEAAKTNFESAWVEKQIEWGNAAKDNIKTMYEFGSTVVENAEKIAKSFGILIGAVGGYKAALIAIAAAQKIAGFATMIQQFNAMTSALRRTTQAQILFNTVLGANPYVKIAGLLSGVIGAMILFRDRTSDAQEALEEFNEEQEKSRGIANDSISTIQDENATMYQKVKAYEALTKASRALTAAYTLEQLMSGEITQSQIAQILNTEKDAAEYKMLTDNVESARKKVEQYQELLSNQGSVGTAGGGSLTYSIGLSRAQKELKEYEASLAEYNKTRAEAIRLEAESLRKSGIAENIQLLTDEKTTIEARTEAYEALKTLSPELAEMYGEEAVALMTLAQAQEAAANAEELAALRKQQTSVQSAISALPASTGAFDIFASTREDLELQAESIAQEIKKVLGRELKAAELTPEQLKALEKEAEARRKMYEQGLLDYETFQQGVDRLAQEHATRVASYEAEAQSPAELAQLTAGSEAQMAGEIEALHEKHETEEYLAKAAAEERLEIEREEAEERRKLQQRELEESQQLQEELLSRYATYPQKRTSLTQEYEANRAAMFTDDSQTSFAVGFDQGNLDNLTNAFEAAMTDLDVTAAKSLGTLGELWGDMSNKATKEIDEVILKAEELYALVAVEGSTYTVDIGDRFGITSEMFAALKDSDSLAEFRERIDEIREQAAEARVGLAGFADAIDKLKRSAEEGDMEGFEAGLQMLQEKISDVAGAMNLLGDLFSAIGDIAGDGFSTAADVMSGVASTLSDTMSAAMTGLAVGGIGGAAVGAAVGLVTSLINAGSQARAEHAQALQDIADGEVAYTAAALALARQRALDTAQFSSVLGTDSYAESLNAARVYADEMANLQSELTELYSLQIVTGSYTTGALWWKEQKDSYSNLLDVYPKLIDAQGNFDYELAQTILDTGELRSSSEEALEQMIATAETAAEAYETLRDYLTDLFGDVGHSIAEAIADGVSSGAIEVEDVLSSLASTFESYITDMAYSIYLADMMDEAAEKMLEIQADKNMSDADRLTAMTDLFGDLASSATDAIPDIEAFIEAAKEAASAEGLGLFEDDDTQGQASASDITSIQEEAPGSIDGKLTSLQITSSQTAVNTTLLVDGQSSLIAGVAELRDGMDMLNYYAKNTYSEVKLIRESTDQLGAIASSVAAVATNTKNL